MANRKTPTKILIIATSRIGDVLLTTPVIRSLRQAYPNTIIDVVVFKGMEGCILANKDIDKIITIQQGATLWEQLKTICRLFRRYDLAISTLTGDRPVFYSVIAAKHSMGFAEKGYKNLWKRLLLDSYALFDNDNTHTVTMNLSILKSLNKKQIHDVIVSWTDEDEASARQLLPFDIDDKSYAVLHVYPMFAYKMWTMKGWIELISRLYNTMNLKIVLIGGNNTNEIEYISTLYRSLPCPCINTSGKLSLGSVGFLLSKATAYVGLDTAVTHMAAALGIPTVALFGPTNPVKWGPMPAKLSFSGKSPYKRKGSQIVKNVFLLQGQGACVPCHEEGCDRNIKSLSKCLQEILAEDVFHAVETILTPNRQTDLQVETHLNHG